MSTVPSGMEDKLFGAAGLRRQHILRIFRNYDVDPNMHPDGTFEQNRLDRLVSDPSVSFDNIRRAAQMAARNGFTTREIAEQYPHSAPVTMSDPMRNIDPSFSFDGEQEFSDSGVTLAENSPLDDNDPGFDMETLLREGEQAESEQVIEGTNLSPEGEPLPDPNATPPISIPEEQQVTEPTGESSADIA